MTPHFVYQCVHNNMIPLKYPYQLTQPLQPRMGVYLRGGNAFVAEQGLDINQLHILFQQARAVCMP